ncbi:MAG TPA: 2-amino-4-hydroxy-6-hydroxymethyldihydropteridine diphosphokinase [Pirellulales bacterium]|nr:2-amino-4-hydroxy-6-hydroxymethyldihydropteridine diphosphokinase [Pirellulales bacterium]
MARALIALGSNLGDRGGTLDAAVAAVSRLPQTWLLATSSWIESAPIGPPQPAYLNGALLVETSLEPLDLLDRLKSIENAAGRVRTLHWGPRTLDLDLLLYADRVCDDHRLTLPHPRVALRRFVLEPAAQIAAAMVHPTTGMTIGELLARFNSTPAYVAVMGPPGSGKTRLAQEVAQRSGALLLLDPEGAEVMVRTSAPSPFDERSPTNSASPAIDREIEFLARRSRLIAVENQPPGRAMISDFWLAQSLAWSEAEYGADIAARVEAAYRKFESRVLPARFLAVLDVGPRQTERTGDAGSAAGGDFYGRVRSAMRSLVRRPGQPPAVWLATDNWENAVAEVLAALAG